MNCYIDATTRSYFLEILEGLQANLNYVTEKAFLWLNITEISTTKTGSNVVSFGVTFDYDENEQIKKKTTAEAKLLSG